MSGEAHDRPPGSPAPSRSLLVPNTLQASLCGGRRGSRDELFHFHKLGPHLRSARPLLSHLEHDGHAFRNTIAQERPLITRASRVVNQDRERASRHSEQTVAARAAATCTGSEQHRDIPHAANMKRVHTSRKPAQQEPTQDQDWSEASRCGAREPLYKPDHQIRSFVYGSVRRLHS